MRRTASIGIAAALAWALTAAPASAATATWQGGSGSYAAPANWVFDPPVFPPRAPCDPGDDVVLGPGSYTVTVDTGCIVSTLSLGDNATLRVEAGASYTVSGPASLFGIVHAVGGQFQALDAAFAGNRARVWAESNGEVTIGATSYAASGLNAAATLFSATGGSTLDLSALQSLDDAFNDSTPAVTTHTISADGGGAIDLSGLLSLNGALRAEDVTEFDVAGGGTITLDSLATIAGAPGRTRFDVHAGSALDLPALQTVTAGQFSVDGGGALTADGAQPLTYSSAGAPFSWTMFLCDGAGSVLDLSAIQSIDAGFNDQTPALSAHAVTALNGGALDLSGLQSLNSAVRAEDSLTFDVSGGGSIDLSALATIAGQSGRTRFNVHSGTTLSLPALQAAHDVLFSADGGGELRVDGPQAAAYTSTGLPGNAALMLADGAGSLLDLSAIQSIDAGFNDQTPASSTHAVAALNGGAIDLSGLVSVSSATRAEDALEFDASASGTIVLTSLATIGPAPGRTVFDVHAGTTLSLPALDSATNALFQAQGGGAILVNGPAPAAYASRIPGAATLMSADGAGSLLDLSAIQSIDAGFNDQTPAARLHSVLAANGGAIDLSGLQSINSSLRPEDGIEFDVSASGTIDLSALATIGGAAGRTIFDAHGAAGLSLPALQTAVNAQFLADGGGTVAVAGPTPAAYASRFPGTISLMSADGGGSLLDLSAIQSIDAGFNDQTPTVNVHAVAALNGGAIDLSGLQSISASVRSEDAVEFDVSASGTIDLSALTTIGGAAGRTVFDSHAGTALSLPSLQSAVDAQFLADGGGAIAVSGPSPATYAVRLPAGTTLMHADGATSLLDLSAIQSFDAAFNDQTVAVNTHTVLSSNGAGLDLSGLVAVTAPVRVEDRLRFKASDGAGLSLASLGALGGAGRVSFEADQSASLTLGSATFAAATHIALSEGGSMLAAGLRDDPVTTRASSLALLDADVTCDVDGSLELGADVDLLVDVPGAQLNVARDLSFAGNDETAVQLEAARLVLDGSGAQTLEVGGTDGGNGRPAGPNFGIGQLVVGQPGQPTLVQLRDVLDNGNRAGGAEALYLLGLDALTRAEPSGLVVEDGSTLSLGCLETYLFSDDGAASALRILDWFTVPGNTRVAWGSGFVQLDVDRDQDGFPDCADNCPLTPNPAQADGDMDGIGDLCEVTLPLSDPGVAQPITGPGAASQGGTVVAATGDANGDSIADFLVGAPGYTPPGGPTAAGAVLLFFGSADAGERGMADVVFVGESAHDRAGTALAGDFDFNDDGFPDILIGAEQTDRSGGGMTPTGAGKAYLIFFDPTDTASYPNLGTPGVADTIDLARVGNGLVDEIPGIVFEGGAPGDRAGFAVAAGRSVDPGILDDIVIGAPGRDTAGGAEAGSAYVIFDDAALSGIISLDRVASGQPNEIDGLVVLGDVAGDELGYAVSFPGDVVGTAGADLAIGAPGADLLAANAGVVFVVEGGTLARDVVEGCSVGDDQPGAQIRGTQIGERAGSAVAGGGDNLVDGEADLLVGAPLFDRGPQLAEQDAGRVVHAASRLPFGFVSAEAIGAAGGSPGALAGVIWIGAAGGDRLGTAVSGLGDINGDGLVEIGLGAPFADPDGVVDAGAIYVAPGLVPPDPFRGAVDIALGFPGSRFTGEQAGEQAGASLAGAGDVDDDGDEDFLVGAPGHDDPVAGSDAGRVYVVLQCGTADTDGDGLLDCEDNCPQESNLDQADGDADGIGDLCDLCPAIGDPGQPDRDADATPDACDNCPDLFNLSQLDADLDGVGDACDTNPVFTVSSDPLDAPDFASIQQAVNTASESGTRIELLPGTGCYLGTVLVDRGMVFDFAGIGNGVCVDGLSGPAFDVRSSFGGTPIGIDNLTLKGLAGIVASASTRVSGITFEDIADVGLDLDAGQHEVREVHAGATVLRGVELAAGASLALRRSTFEDLLDTAMRLDGQALVENCLVAQSVEGLIAGSTGDLTLRHSTVASTAGTGVDNAAGGLVAIAHTIVWDNATADLTGVGCAAMSWSLSCSPSCAGTNDNLCADPLFVDGNADYHLQAASPAVEHGPDPASLSGMPCLDLDGGPRVRDHDGDGLARLDVGSHERSNPGLSPPAADNLRWTDAQTLLWDGVPGAAEYHVYRAPLSGLGYAFFGTCRDDLDADRTDTALSDAADPVVGEPWFYLITAEDGSGSEGSLGLGSCIERSNFAACPAAAASPMTKPVIEAPRRLP